MLSDNLISRSCVFVSEISAGNVSTEVIYYHLPVPNFLKGM